jgi:hypothetical protein
MHQHLSGLYNRIPQGDSPEDIQKWKAERRKNYPTRFVDWLQVGICQRYLNESIFEAENSFIQNLFL